MIKRYFYVGLGGGIGALSRSVLLEMSQQATMPFPYATLLINLIGAFLLTFSLNLTLLKIKFTHDFKLAVNVGLIGSFTTFSLIMTDVISLIHFPWLFILYYFTTIFGGLFMSYLGFQFAQGLNKRGDIQ